MSNGIEVIKAPFFINKNNQYEMHKVYNYRPGRNCEEGMWFFYADLDIEYGDWFNLQGIIMYLADPSIRENYMFFCRLVTQFGHRCSRPWDKNHVALCQRALEYFGENYGT